MDSVTSDNKQCRQGNEELGSSFGFTLLLLPVKVAQEVMLKEAREKLPAPES